MHPTPSIRSESERELLDLHFHRRPLPEFQDTVGTCRTKKQRQRQATPSRGESPKGMKDLQITKLGDDQEMRPFPKWRKGRELLASTKKTQWMRKAKKVQHRKPAPPMRKNRPEQKITKKQRQLLKQVPPRKPTHKGNRGKGATWTPPCSQVSQPTGRRPKFSKARRRKNEVSDPLEHKVSITQDIPLSRERTERD